MTSDKPERRKRWTGRVTHGPAETEDFPSLVIMDGRVGGSITVGRSRLGIIHVAAIQQEYGPNEVQNCYPYVTDEDERRVKEFALSLAGLTGEWARLACVLADVQRQASNRRDRDFFAGGWIERPKDRKRVRAALLACLADLDAEEAQ